MWPVIRTALQRPQTIVVLALLFLVADALLSILSPASAAAHPHRLHPSSFPGCSAPTIVNEATGQVALANAPQRSSESAGPPTPSTGSAPYTMQQVARGSEVYAKACAACHGANLQGVSANCRPLREPAS
jgi:cytochrome c1